jgi:uncharacterized integral membrane protein
MKIGGLLSIVAAIMFLALVLIFVFANPETVNVALWPGARPFSLPIAAILIVGALVGTTAVSVLLMFLLDADMPWFLPATLCAVALAVGSAWAGEIKLWQAMLAVLFGSAALGAAARAIRLIGEGQTIELQSQWGGLGGTIGGWRLSPATSLILLALVFAGAAVSVSMPAKPGGCNGTGDGERRRGSANGARQGTHKARIKRREALGAIGKAVGAIRKAAGTASEAETGRRVAVNDFSNSLSGE